MDDLKSDKIEKILSEIQKDVAEIKVDLQYHIKRTDLLSEQVLIQENQFKSLLSQQTAHNEKLLEAVVKSNSSFTSLIMKLIVTASIILGSLMAIFKVLQ